MPITQIVSNALYDISTVSKFIKFHSNSFESRYFNSVKGDEFTVVKTSTNKGKILREYRFYGLLPESMKHWFVMPFNYTEYENGAAYEMERLHMVDIATRWIHQAIDEEEFVKILDKAFRFIEQRSQKNVDLNTYKEVEENLYLHKLEERMDSLKTLSFYDKINHYISKGTAYESIDDIVNDYKNLLKAITHVKIKNPHLVVGHGDLCFSNMLYSQSVDMLRLIDPKGALTEEEIWTNPYYDIAKLSHSICGLYDFINTGLFDIQLDETLKLCLVMAEEMASYKDIFKKYLEQKNIDYVRVRLYETSLFLSMLPLHAENEKKVLGYILNAVQIMKEVKTCMKI
jgi:thiamine kinase-like enzyme